MDIKILNREENKLLDREELIILIEHRNSATPNRTELRQKLSAMLGIDEKLIVIRKILSEYGKQRSKAFVNVYKSEEIRNKLEPKYILKRNKLLQ